MKKKITLAIIIFLIVGITLILVKNKDTEIEKDEEVKYNSSFISMMIEQEDEKYIESKDLKFPNESYMFNPDKSGCENGGLLSWNMEKQKVQASLISSDKCYAYFDKYDFIESCLFGYEDNLACELIKKKDNTLIYHDGICDYEGEENCDLEAGDNNYRFVGANPNNYVCFGGDCSNDSANPNYKNLYRIIGLFKNEDNESEDYGKYEIKLIKADAATKDDLGDKNINNSAYHTDIAPDAQYYKGKLKMFAEYYWNSSDSAHLTFDDSTNTNMWKDSNLNKVNLNDFYYNSIEPIYKKMIAEHKWQVGSSAVPANAKAVFDSELGNKKLTSSSVNCYTQNGTIVKDQKARECNESNDLTYNAPVGLIYVSDYMYGTLPKYWTSLAADYDNEEVNSNDWLYLGIYEWTISRAPSNPYYVRNIRFSGSAYNAYYVYVLHEIRPTFYLSSDAKKAGGTGTENDPFKLTE